MTTKTILISNAVALLGHKPITSLENADNMVNAAIQAYDLLLPDILSQNNWRFATAIQPLVQSMVIPPQPWRTAWQLPSGFLKLIRLYPNIYQFDLYANSLLYTFLQPNSFPVVTVPPSPYPVFNYNNYQPFSIEYIFEPTTDQLPPRFQTYFVYEIAKYLALSTAQRPDYAQYLTQQCQYHYAMAAANEAQNRPQFSQVLFPVLVNRNIGGFIGNTTGGG